MKSVLFVDPDAHMREMVAERLAPDQEHFRLRLAGTGEEALKWLEAEDVFLVITEARLPDMSGPALIRQVRDRSAEVETVLTCGAPDEKTREVARKNRCLALLEKPLDTEAIRKLIADQYHLHGEGFAGTLKHIQLDDLIQMCCPSGVSLTIRVRRGKQEGIIFIEEGDVVHAVCEESTGEDAFFQILGWRGGYFETLSARRVSERTIHQSHAYLIMEAARRADETVQTEDCSTDTEIPGPECTVAEKLRVLLVDDSPMMCRVLSGLLVADGDIEIVGTANNGEKALAMCTELKPDLVALDVNMPVMDGRSALKHIMIQHPCPVVIMSNVVRGGEASVMEFLTLGAVDFVSKPVRNRWIAIQHQKIRERIRAAARARVSAFSRSRVQPVRPPAAETGRQSGGPCRSMVIVNSGAGGFVELVNLIGGLDPSTRSAVIGLQTIPPAFSAALVDYVRQRTGLPVTGIRDRTPLAPGCCHLGTNGTPVELDIGDESGWCLRTGATVGFYPSREYNHFDILLGSAASMFDGSITVVLLSGADVVSVGALKMIRERGGQVLVQRLDKAVAPDPLEPVVSEGIATAEAGTRELIERISALSPAQAK